MPRRLTLTTTTPKLKPAPRDPRVSHVYRTRVTAPISPATQRRIQRLAGTHTPADIAERVGVSRTTVYRYLPARTPATSLAAPFGPGPQPASNAPPIAWALDQPQPPPTPTTFRPGYHDHTYRAFSTPLGYDGWTVERIRAAIAMHDQGLFLESSLLKINVTRFGPVYTALSQAIAPVLALPRFIVGGTRGLGRLLAAELEAQLCPRGGLLPSPYFPETLWGAMAIELKMMGFVILQHAYGDPHPLTGVRALYTRWWPAWATTYYPSRRTFVANTDSGPVDVLNDGKFTLIADTDEPHHGGAIRALALEVMAGVMADQAMSSYLDRYGNPKLWGTMPPGVAVDSPPGQRFFEALGTLLGPNGYGALPHGSKLDWAQLSASQNAMFKDSDEKISARCAGILLGSNGTVTQGTGGVYQSPSFMGVRRDLTDRTLKACVRGVNLGVCAPYLEINYAASIAEARGWVEPVLSIPLPDPDADARMKSYGERAEKRTAIVKAERDAGLDVTQERVDQLSAELGLQRILLVSMAAEGGEVGRDEVLSDSESMPDSMPEEPVNPDEGGMVPEGYEEEEAA